MEHYGDPRILEKEIFYEKKTFFIFSISAVLNIACSDNSSESETGLTYHYDTSIDYNEQTVLLDSISSCLNDSIRIESIYKFDTIFVERQQKKEMIAFSSQIHSSKDNIKSIGVHSFGDTLKIELIEKEKTLDADICCLVWVYGTVNDKIDAKYIKTFTGVYPLGSK